MTFTGSRWADERCEGAMLSKDRDFIIRAGNHAILHATVGS